MLQKNLRKAASHPGRDGVGSSLQHLQQRVPAEREAAATGAAAAATASLLAAASAAGGSKQQRLRSLLEALGPHSIQAGAPVRPRERQPAHRRRQRQRSGGADINSTPSPAAQKGEGSSEASHLQAVASLPAGTPARVEVPQALPTAPPARPRAPDCIVAAHALHRLCGLVLWDEAAAPLPLHQLAPGPAIRLRADGGRQAASGKQAGDRQRGAVTTRAQQPRRVCKSRASS